MKKSHYSKILNGQKPTNSTKYTTSKVASSYHEEHMFKQEVIKVINKRILISHSSDLTSCNC